MPDIVPLLDWQALPRDLPSLAALAVGLGWASGLRLYALVFALGMLVRFGSVQLPDGLMVLGHPVMLGLSGILLVLEFFADKLAWLDSIWDGLHTFIRIPAGATLAAAVMGDHGTAVQLITALLGGSLAATTHFTKAGLRAAINTSPEPFSNIGTSLGEDTLLVVGLWTLFLHPAWFLAGLAAFLLLAGWLLHKVWRFIRRRQEPGQTPPQAAR